MHKQLDSTINCTSLTLRLSNIEFVYEFLIIR